jgi:hypothetical protein
MIPALTSFYLNWILHGANTRYPTKLVGRLDHPCYLHRANADGASKTARKGLNKLRRWFVRFFGYQHVQK